jgi:deazaflavin-dependent oxidoreductase (nitroreductase family)
MTASSARRTRAAQRFWAIVNPVARPLAGLMPWWILLETTGRKSRQKRLTPLANGPVDDGVLHLISVLGVRAAFALNIAADPHVRVKRRGRWHTGTAEVVPIDDAVVRRFSFYGRFGLRTFGDDARLIRIRLDA